MSAVELRPYKEPVEVRSEGGKLVLSGVAIRYGARSRDLGGFRERIMPGAATEVIQKGDVFAYAEHRNDRYLGRTLNGSLRLIDSGTDLRYEVDLPDTQIGREVAALAERGDYGGSSFGFRTAPEMVEWTKDDDGTARFFALQVLELAPRGIRAIDHFMSASAHRALFAAGLPASMPNG